jgi:hypothetical protein
MTLRLQVKSMAYKIISNYVINMKVRIHHTDCQQFIFINIVFKYIFFPYALASRINDQALSGIVVQHIRINAKGIKNKSL